MKAPHRLLLTMACVSSLQLSAASISGVWQGRLIVTSGSREMRREVTLRLAVNRSSLTGTMTAESDTAEILDGMVNGYEVSFAIPSGADDVPKFEFHGSVVGDLLTVTVSGRLNETGEVLRIGEGSFKRSE